MAPINLSERIRTQALIVNNTQLNVLKNGRAFIQNSNDVRNGKATTKSNKVAKFYLARKHFLLEEQEG